MSLTHRTRLTILTTSIGAALLAVVLVLVYGVFRFGVQKETQANLQAVLSPAVDDLQREGRVDLQEWIGTYPNMSLAVYQSGRETERAGHLRLPFISGAGVAFIKGRLVSYRALRVKDVTLIVAGDWEQQAHALQLLAGALLTIWLAFTASIATTTAYVARATFRPLREMTLQAAGFGERDLSARLDLDDAAEFGLFASQLNEFLERLEALVKREEQFAEDAAHELRTPLTIIQGKAENALKRERSPEEYQNTLLSVLEESRRLSKLVEMLLQTARIGTEPVDKLELKNAVEMIASRWFDQFMNKDVVLEVHADAAHAAIALIEFETLLNNLLENALHFSPPGTVCAISLISCGRIIELSVADQGQGVPDEQREVIFERFLRLDGARERREGGFGIGLAVCKRIVEGRGGKISLDSSYRHGAKFVITMDAA